MRRIPRGSITLAATIAGALALTLAACGSQIDPSTVASANGGGSTLSGGVAGGGDVALDGTVPGDAGVGTDPGSVDSGGSLDAGGGTTTATDAGGTTGGDPAAGDGGTGGSAGGGEAPVDESKSGSCDGFKNGPGVTDSTITIGNSSDISGPVPGLFETAQDGTKAFVKYFNATSDICGRKLALKTYDSRTDAAADQQAYTAACKEVFAMIGSVSAFDSGGAAVTQSCGLPDLRGGSVTTERSACTICFGAQSVNPGQVNNATPDFIKKNYPSSAQKMAFLYINAGAAVQNAKLQVSAMTKRGLKFLYVQPIDVSEFNYATYVQQLKDRGVEGVFWTGAYQQSVRLRQAMAQQGYTPKIYMRDPTDYNPEYVSSGGSAVDGTIVYTNFVPFEEAASNPEMGLYLNYLRQVNPSADPAFFGVFGWSAARLFTQLANELGGDLSRETLIDKIRGTKNWTANGLTSPQQVGPKQTGECWRFIQLKGGKWNPVGGSKYSCNGVTTG
ncbi:ABC transporter substrate-binding protein [Nocardioides salsibiostraticola]